MGGAAAAGHAAAAGGARGGLTRERGARRGVDCLTPEWPAPAARARRLHAAQRRGERRRRSTTLNLGAHVGDAPPAVAENRRRVRRLLALPAEPLWLEQVHGTAVFDPDAAAAGHARRMRTPLIARSPGQVARDPGRRLPAGAVRGARRVRGRPPRMPAGAGWPPACSRPPSQRSAVTPARLLAWLGPAIGPRISRSAPRCAAPSLAQDPARRRPSPPTPGAAGSAT